MTFKTVSASDSHSFCHFPFVLQFVCPTQWHVYSWFVWTIRPTRGRGLSADVWSLGYDKMLQRWVVTALPAHTGTTARSAQAVSVQLMEAAERKHICFYSAALGQKIRRWGVSSVDLSGKWLRAAAVIYLLIMQSAVPLISLFAMASGVFLILKFETPRRSFLFSPLVHVPQNKMSETYSSISISW